MITKPPSQMQLVLCFGKRIEKFEIDDHEFVIGRSDKLKVSASYCSTVSREHLRVTVKNQEIWITDLNSSNGTYHLNERIKPNVPIRYEGGALCLGPPGQGLTVSISLPEVIVPPEPEPVVVPTPEVKDIELPPVVETIVEKKKEEPVVVHHPVMKQVESVPAPVLDSELRQKQLEFDEYEQEIAILKNGLDEYGRLIKDQVEKAKVTLSETESKTQEIQSELVNLNQKMDASKSLLKQHQEEASNAKVSLDELLKKTTESKQELIAVQSEVEKAQAQKKSFIDECDRIKQDQLKFTEIAKLAQDEKSKTDEELKLIKAQIEKAKTSLSSTKTKTTELQNEFNSLTQKMQDAEKEFQLMKEQSLATIEKDKLAWSKEYELLKEKANHDLLLWKVAEEKNIQKMLLQDVNNLAHHVATHAAAKFSGNEIILTANVVQALEENLKDSILNQSQGNQSFNPNLKKQAQKFKVKVAASIAASIVILFAIAYGPKFLGSKIDSYKKTSLKESNDFMVEMRAQRERMLALQLEPRKEFQETYVNNILYNPGYLAMKQNESLRKKWVAVLSKFFFKELLLDDRKVVEYIPIETSMIRELAEVNQVLNAKNFDVNLIQMEKIEKQKLEKILHVVGGYANWNQLRKREAEFYSQQANSESDVRVPASGASAK